MDTVTHHQAAVLKMEDPIRASRIFYYFPTAGGLLDYYHTSSSELVDDQKGTSLGGFMELLGMKDFSFCELHNAITRSTNTMLLQVPPPVSSSYPREPRGGALTSQAGLQTMPPTAAAPGVVVPEEEEPDVTINNNNKNGPAPPNSSSISLEDHSSGAPRDIGDHHHEHISRSAVDYHEYDDPEEHEQPPRKISNNKHLKAKKTREKKRQKERRFAFITKSEVDHLEDGYRWRKYGQKAVKNSPFPRSYYRCTSASCNVKKRVERSFNDPSIVVTTYEGQHIHPSPITHHRLPPGPGPCPSPGTAGAGRALIFPQGPDFFFSTALASFGLPMPMQMPLSPQPQHLNSYNLTLPLHRGFTSTNINSTATPLERRLLATPKPFVTALLRDDGLLQDVVSPP